MVFSDLFFLFVFLPVFFACYIAATLADRRGTPRADACAPCTSRNAVLVAFSLVFYAWGEPVYVFLMIASSVINYIAGLAITRGGGRSRGALAAGVGADIAVLLVFKYAGFIAAQMNSIGIPMPVPHIPLPIGISFYTFQSISYLVDVYRGEARTQRRFADLLLYISMFPQLIAGPIVRYGTVAASITRRVTTVDDVAEGVWRFIIGLGKKVIIANQLSEVSEGLLVKGFGDLSPAGAWIGIIAFTLQIYFDFSGYSDMAIGIGRCIGFKFNENFNHPYCCTSITDFWRRWHISLGSFFRDYVYIPLGGNRRHQMLNIFIVWMLTGAWHGASWNFIIWGLYFGVIVAAEKYTLQKIIRRVPKVLLHIYSKALIVIGFGIFYFEDPSQMGTFFRRLFFLDVPADMSLGLLETGALTDKFWLWAAAIVFTMPVRGATARLTDRCAGPVRGALCMTARVCVSLALLVLSVALLVGATNNAFIYTRF